MNGEKQENTKTKHTTPNEKTEQEKQSQPTCETVSTVVPSIDFAFVRHLSTKVVQTIQMDCKLLPTEVDTGQNRSTSLYFPHPPKASSNLHTIVCLRFFASLPFSREEEKLVYLGPCWVTKREHVSLPNIAICV